MKDLKIKVSDALYNKIKDASVVVGKSTEATVKEFLEESADVVLSGNVIEVDDFETFEKLRKYTEKTAAKKKPPAAIKKKKK